ncbi:putative choline transport protein [Amylocarpus encephaloides]|uniref:Choline transport protein n=1 Tax=Amylocarpus encephaloides TaxID=45428 RepID=A0A9P7YRB0_9HELO|nr:putative choline transport protein [Amylocarpus encephaloides]
MAPTSSRDGNSSPFIGSEKNGNLRVPHYVEVNETGHVQELERNFSLFSICSVGIVTGNSWAALGGSIAELASSMPSSAGPKYGRICGWFAGWWNTFAWITATASMSSVSGQIVVAMYGLYHPEYLPERWHIFIALPKLNDVGLIFILGGVLTTMFVCAVMPHTSGTGYATSSFVWTEWANQTGYTSNGFVFLAGMLNGAYAVGAVDCCAHLAEEIPNPKRNIPFAIGSQMIIGFFTAFFYLIAIFYGTTDLDSVLGSAYFPLTQIYAQATGSRAGAMGLLFLIFFPIICCCVGTFITAGRGVWTLGRDEAIPFSKTFGKISPRFKNPFNATLLCGVFSMILGAIYVGSTTAFNAFIVSFAVLSTLSYLAAILPFIFTRRFSRASHDPGPYINSMQPGPFQMSHAVGYTINIMACLYIVVLVIIFCFPYSLPVTAVNMNYACLITGAISISAAAWWAVKGGSYVGPKVLLEGDVAVRVGGEMVVKVM